jgi:hypothetical protein
MPANVYKQTLTVNNHGTYTIYSSSTDGSSLKKFLFDYNTSSNTGGGSWYWFNANGTYAANAGTYIVSQGSYIKSDYLGDWIIIKLPYKIVLTRFRFYHRTNGGNFVSRAPGLWKCYGSNDGVNFTEIIDASNTITIIPSTSYTTNGYYEKILPIIFDIPYLYIGWTINNLVGNDPFAYILNFAELQIFGKDDISNSYLNVWNKSNTSIFNTLGNVGIGTTNPTNLLHLHKQGNNQEVMIRFTDTSTGTSITNGVGIYKTDQHDLFLHVYENARMYFFTNNIVRMNIQANGNTCIGASVANSIFQVGDGARLRISNGITDYSLIGTKDVDDATNTRIVISGNTRTISTGNIEYLSTSTGNHIFYTTNSTTERMRISNNGNVGIGTNVANATLELYSATQLSSRIILSGQEFYTNTSIVSGGIAILCGVNRTGNRQLWIGDSLNLAQNTTNQILRLMVGGIDCIATNGTTSLPMSLGGTGAATTINGSMITLNGNVGIGTNTNHSAATRLTIRNSSSGYSQPLVRIEQTAGWNGNYALEVIGYTNLNGFRINGNDTGNSLYMHLANQNMGFSQNETNTTGGNITFTTFGSGGNIVFNTSGANERMRILSDGNIGIGTTNTQTYNLYVNGTSYLNNNTNVNGTLRIDNTNKFSLNGTGNVEIDAPGVIGGRFFINSSGNIGIGTTTSLLSRLNVNGNLAVSGVLTASGTSSSGTIAARYFNNGAILTQSNTASFNDVCGKFNGSIWVTSWIASSSDSRIKNNINNINDNNALIKILAIEPKTYNYIDIIEKGSNIVYGFIAQQIKEVIPEAVNIQKSVIPNIYSTHECSNNIINITSNIENLKVNDRISIIQENIEKKNYTITEIIPESNQIKINENLEGSNCFVYGTEVDDFHALNKDYIFTLNVCATQELHKIIQQQQQQIEDLIRRIEILESK